ncbi:hypothetical protein BKA59DRAFT_546846 [Fusarium tricinctum]|uniref:Zn(2)-C6 fungal-type domain-containing protein n=1 Tax=Fusarium tricinctum TaxID=61284 RepID=A0A8K0WAE1_9HYPO|nr:hypothetical protein BKA59DRAFT_546846 [Fusarium tricinctum]
MGEHISLDEQHLTTDSTPGQKRHPEADALAASKRRKLRKGTQSCWECKRRKSKCIFSGASEVCDFCKRRGTDCVSQEVTEKPPPPGSNKHIVDRLGEVEALVQHLLKSARSEGRSLEGLISPVSLESRRKSLDNRRTQSRSPNAAISHIDVDEYDNSTTANSATPVLISEELLSSAPLDKTPPVPDPHNDLYRDLVAAWPSPQDMEVILSLPADPAQIIRVMTCTPPKDHGSTLPSPATLLRLPPRGSHPILVARKLLILATFLQGVPLSSESHFAKLSTSYETIMARIVKLVHNRVTCNDDLVSSLEGIECMMLESLYENYAGNLRRSWLATRKTVMIAQMLGLNKSIIPPSFRGAAIEPDELWFRLINLDRYLCLMLGLPQSSPDEPVGSISLPDTLPSNRKLQVLCSTACGLLLRRRPSELCDQAFTKEIDKLLRDACTSMPAQWWIMPNLASCTDLPDKLSETLRFNDHMMQYHLLLQLHMPYMLRIDDGNQYGYYKLAAISASREVLTRFVSVRAIPQTRYYCRGTDLIAFVACTTLTLAHILCDHRHKRIEDNGFHFLEQQRLSDRGLLEQVLTIAETLARKSDDDISKRLMTLLHYLLALEDNVTAGIRYTVSFGEESTRDGDLAHHLKASEDGTVLDIHLPNFPVIKIVRRDSEGNEALPVLLEVPWGLIPPGQKLTRGTNHTMQNHGDTTGSMTATQDSSVAPEHMLTEPWTLEGFDMSFLDNFMEGPVVT